MGDSDMTWLSLGAIIALFIVFGMKYYTSIEMRKLNRRLQKVKAGLELARTKLKKAHEKQEKAAQEVKDTEQRHLHVEEMIADIKARLGAPADKDEAIEAARNPNPNTVSRYSS
jgi:F0F1-type ATP synthase membrane subunit b/b'